MLHAPKPTAPLTLGRKIILPDGQQVILREGEELTIARSNSSQQITVKVTDPTVSSTPIRIIKKGGDLYVTGGGTSGFAIVETRRYPATDMIKLPKMQSIKGGSTRLSITAGKDTKLVVE